MIPRLSNGPAVFRKSEDIMGPIGLSVCDLSITIHLNTYLDLFDLFTTHNIFFLPDTFSLCSTYWRLPDSSLKTNGRMVEVKVTYPNPNSKLEHSTAPKGGMVWKKQHGWGINTSLRLLDRNKKKKQWGK